MVRSFAEFFAGIGLVRLALEQLGWHCLFANDIDPKKAEIYCQNFPSEDLVIDDIFNLNLDSVPVEAELWTASFPCIDLSLAGNRGGINAKHSGAYWGLINLLEVAHNTSRCPRFVLLENVVGFASSADGADLASALSALSRFGYCYDIVVIDAKHFTPQSRPRLFVVAELEKRGPVCLHRPRPLEFDTPARPAIVRKFVADHPKLNWAHLSLPTLPNPCPELVSIIEELPPSHESWWPANAVDRLVQAMSPLHRQRLATMLASNKVEYGTVYRRVRQRGTMAELRADGLAGCLRTPRGGSSKQFLLEAREGQIRVRHLTVRECARLQGVPDTFRLDVPANQAWFGLGDAVCVPTLRWLAEQFCGLGRPAAKTLAAG